MESSTDSIYSACLGRSSPASVDPGAGLAVGQSMTTYRPMASSYRSAPVRSRCDSSNARSYSASILG